MKTSDLITGIQHVGIPTTNLGATIDFYESLGFEAVLHTVNASSGGQVVFLRLKNITIETYAVQNAAEKPGAIDHIALDVTDIEETFACISEGSYTLLDRTVQFLPFWENGVKFFTILGPNGEKVEFCQKL